ncbi:MAG: class I SAM-dependent methyltransferase [Candidatus Aenigmarchaeota archaeon]|nr:class I SAM-dependent methyltransferase [Candidatus Aenigmarchaeota archaeon]
MASSVWESEYLEVYDTILLNSEIYLTVRDFHVNAMRGCPIILDSCCGTGNTTLELLKKGHIVYAIDQSKKARDILRKKCAQYANRLPILNADAKHLTEFEDEMFDGISSMFAVYYINDFEQYLREIYRILKPNGIFALTGRVSAKNMELILKSYENSLREKGLLPGLNPEFSIFRKKFLNNVTKAVINCHTFKEMSDLLKKIGFKNIWESSNPYLGQCYSLIAQK